VRPTSSFLGANKLALRALLCPTWQEEEVAAKARSKEGWRQKNEFLGRGRKEEGKKLCVCTCRCWCVCARVHERMKREGAHVMVSRDAQQAVPRSLSCSKDEHMWKPKEETEDPAARSSKQHQYREMLQSTEGACNIERKTTLCLSLQ